MALQNLINIAGEVIVDTRPITGSQLTRSGVIKTQLTTGRQPWKFTVSIPNRRWTDVRGWISGINTLGYAPQTVAFNSGPGMNWWWRWTGDPAFDPTFNTNVAPQIEITAFSGTTMTIRQVEGLLPPYPAVPDGGVLVRAGDLIGVGSEPYPFMTTSGVTIPSPSVPGATYTVNVHRPNFLTSSFPIPATIQYGGVSLYWRLVATSIPRWRLVPGAATYAGGVLTNNAVVEFDGPLELCEWLGDI